jgi:hypothetical protein
VYDVTVSFARVRLATPSIHPSVGFLMNIKGMLHYDTMSVVGKPVARSESPDDISGYNRPDYIRMLLYYKIN